VLVTTESNDSDSAALNKLERVRLLPKPFTPAQLADALNHVTSGQCLPPASSETGPMDRSRIRVLIVDDSAVARINMRSVLQSLGFSQFLEVPDGAHAIAVAAREICHLIVTDYNMPLMDGRALVSYLKQNPSTTAIPIIMVTTETDPDVLDPVRRLGVVAVVEKAFPASTVGPLLDGLFGCAP
jgi:two-component system chemotaxis response regulator CheY